MDKKLTFIFLIAVAIISLNYSSGPASVVGQGYTGAPGESGTLCSTCHSAGAFGTPSTVLTITDSGGNVVTSYNPGETYQVTLTTTPGSGSPSGYGFQMTVLDGTNADVASFANPSSNAKISTAASVAGGRTYAEHNGVSATNTFILDWTAPVGGTGDLNFYFTVNLVNLNGGTSGDSGSNGFIVPMTESIPTVDVLGALNINNAFTFPIVDGMANQVLVTDGAGTVTWMDAPTTLQGPSTNDRFSGWSSQTDLILQQHKEMEELRSKVDQLKLEIIELKRMIRQLSTSKN